MNAREARELSEKNLTGVVVKPLLEAVYKRIKEAATAHATGIASQNTSQRNTFSNFFI
jgi:hypothetical protein